MADAELLKRLQEIQGNYDQAERPERPPERDYGNWYDNFVQYGEADYQGIVQAWDLFPGRKDPSALWLKMTVSVANHPELSGSEIPIMFNIMDPEKLPYLKDHFWRLGVTELDLTQLAPGSELLNRLLDTPVLVGVYQGKGGGWWATLRQSLDSSDLGSAQQQIEGFESNTTPSSTMQTAGQMAAQAERMQKKASGKPEGCTCPDPANGVFDDEHCPVPGHSIGF